MKNFYLKINAYNHTCIIIMIFRFSENNIVYNIHPKYLKKSYNWFMCPRVNVLLCMGIEYCYYIVSVRLEVHHASS